MNDKENPQITNKDIEEYIEEIKKTTEHPIVKKRGELFRNWIGSCDLSLQSIHCPICEGKFKLIYEDGHTLSHQELINITHKEYQDALRNEEDNKKLKELK